MKEKKSLLENINWRKLIVILCVFTILTFLPIITYLYLSKTIQSVAYTTSDDFNDTTFLDITNSKNYTIASGKVSVEEIEYGYGTGSDGSCTVSTSRDINTTSCVGRENGDAVNFSVTSNVSAGATSVTLSSTPTGLAIGDEILIINLQGTTSSSSDVGEYDTAYVTDITTNTLTLDRELVNGYAGTTDKIMVQRIPQYTNVTVDSGVIWSPTAYNGTKGGVLAFKATGTVTVTGTISSSGKGYRLGTGGDNRTTRAKPGEGGIVITSTWGQGGDSSSSYAGIAGQWSGGGGGGRRTTYNGGAGGAGSTNYGASGGGGAGNVTRVNEYKGLAGNGGGGGNGTGGSGGTAGCALGVNGTDGTTTSSGAGGKASSSDSSNTCGGGGGGGSAKYGSSDLSRLTMGGGGGGGGEGMTQSGLYYTGKDGGNGGGIILIDGKDITISGAVQSMGNGGTAGNTYSGSGGGGAGGSIKLIGDSLTISTNLVNASGGTYGGGSGRIRVEYVSSLSGTSLPSATTQNLPVYSNSMILQSLDLIPIDSNAEVLSFSYTLSLSPVGTASSIQFSTDADEWYNSSGDLNGSDVLSIGVDNTIDLTELDWQTPTFFYKITVDTNSGADTPVLENVSLSYDSTPVVPTIGAPEALSTNTIRWNFTDNATNEEGFALYDEENTFVQYCLGQDLTYCDEAGLDENAQYIRSVRAYNDSGDSASSELAYAYTLVSVPTILEGGSKSASSLTLSALGQVNSSEIYFDCEDSGCDTGLNIWTTDSVASSTGLDFNTEYNFRVKGRNRDAVETAYSDSISIYTLSEVPSISLTPLSSTSVSLQAENINNISDGSSGVFFECEELDCNEGISEWLQTDTASVTGLNPNTLSFFRVMARNFDGIETIFSDYVGIYTLSTLPNKPIILGRETNSLIVGLDEDDNPSGTEYALVEDGSGKYVDFSTNVLVDDPVWGTYENYGAENGLSITGLEVGTEYAFKVKARNEDDIETEYSGIETTSTKMSIPSSLTALTITSNSITWRVTDSNVSKTGYKIYDTNDTLLLTCLVNAMNECVERNLVSNTSYSRKVKVFSEISESDYSNTFVVSTYSEPSTVSSVVPLSSESVQLNISGSSRDNLQILETLTNQYYNSTLKVLTQSLAIIPYISNTDIVGLQPNTKYEFKVRSLNKNNVASAWSSTQSTYTYSQVPGLVKVDLVSSTSVRVFLNNFLNPSDTELLVRENNSGKYIDFTNESLVDTEKWGNISNFGLTNGILINGLDVGGQYGFSVKARNKLLVGTEWSSAVYVGTSAILKNIDSRLSATLASSLGIDLTLQQNGQFGERTVRIKQGDFLVADIPVLFNQDRDWKDVVILTSVEGNKAVIKVNNTHGVSKPFTMYVVRGKTNNFIVCPTAKTLNEVSKNCQNGVTFSGSFPQSIISEGNTISVSQSIFGGVDYWVADGITGTGGLGYYVEPKVEEKVIQDTKDKVGNTSSVVPTSVENVVRGSNNIFQYIKETTLGIISYPIKDMEERELQRITTTANVVTITVGTTAILGGLTQLGYSVLQFFMVILSSIGLRKKRVSYGFVYNSNSKEPVHMALVRIYGQDNRLVETSVTGPNGRFSGSLDKGKYTLKVSKSGYEFPSVYIKGSTDYPLQNVYSGSLYISSEDSEIQIAIPIDPKEVLGGQKIFYTIKNITLKTLSIANIFLFLGGVSASMYTCYNYPNTSNFVILVLYIIPLYILISSLVKRKGRYGKVVNESGKPLSNISVIIREKEFNKVIAKRVTNSKGKYRFILDKGKYELDVDEKYYDLVEIKRGGLLDVRKDNYILSKKIKVRKV